MGGDRQQGSGRDMGRVGGRESRRWGAGTRNARVREKSGRGLGGGGQGVGATPRYRWARGMGDRGQA